MPALVKCAVLRELREVFYQGDLHRRARPRWSIDASFTSDNLPAGDFDTLGVDPAIVFAEKVCDHRTNIVWHSNPS